MFFVLILIESKILYNKLKIYIKLLKSFMVVFDENEIDIFLLKTVSKFNALFNFSFPLHIIL